MAASPTTSSGSPTGDLAGRLLADRYRLNKPIASGGMAQVWEATDQVLARRVAVKILHPHLAADASFVKRFRAEAVAAARLAHPSIVSVYDTLTDGGLNAIVMELVVGTTMRADLDQHGPLKLDAVLAIGTQVADALGAAHASGLVHRDVKPANILLSADGRVLVADFGIAKAAEGADLTSDGSMVGTAKYLAPEQVEGGPVDGRTDLYGLGVVLYEALTGQPPFVADTDTGTALARLHRDPVPPRRLRPQIPVAVEHVVMQALARRPDDRYPDAATMRRALLAAGADPSQAPAVAQAAVAAASGERPIAAHGPSPAGPGAHGAPPPDPDPSSPRSTPRTGRSRRRWALAAVVVLALLVGAAVFVTRLEPGDPGGGGRSLTVSAVVDFDPFGDEPREENRDQLAAINDDDPASSWSTERYRAPDLGDKPGVGLVAAVEGPADLQVIEVGTPVGGWSAAVYVVDGEVPGDLDGWGEPVTSVQDVAAGTVQIDLGGRRGSSVLLWLTKLPPLDDTWHAAQVTTIAIRGS